MLLPEARLSRLGSTSARPIPETHLGRAWLALQLVFTPSHVAVAAPIVMVAFMGWQQRWISDDGWINIRVLNQFFAGNGPVFNIGERVEVTTSTLWFWMLVAGRWLLPGTEPQVTGAAVGWVLTLLGMVTAALGAARLFARRNTFVTVPVGILAMAALPPFWDFATSGLETGLSFAWLGTSFWLLTRRIPPEIGGPLRNWPLAAAICIGLGPLIRPDFALYAGLFALALLFTRLRGWWQWLICCTIGIAPAVAYQIWRMGFYALMVPNTALAKSAGDVHWEQGLIYLIDYAGLYVLAVPLLVGLLGVGLHLAYAVRRRELGRAVVVAAPVLGALLHALYIVRMGGDFMHARFLLPDTFALMLPAAVIAVDKPRRETAMVVLAFVAGWAVAISTSARTPYQDSASEDGIANERAFWAATTTTNQLLTINDWRSSTPAWDGQLARWNQQAGLSYYDDGSRRLPTRSGTGIYLARDNMGILPVMAGNEVRVVDRLALADPITSHAVEDPRLQDKTRVGHQPRPAAWRTARYVKAAEDDSQSVAHARLALQCGDLAVLEQAVTEPMTSERFWENVSLAPRLTTFTFPADPAEARKALCGWQPGW
ncbi:hypothetical protein [Enemella evansiae]|uniref:hypothetical protein n=1 Tax=Enemella evansiae TaxID=2016499 RepID=UPI000B96DE67|nr:hypothetical protein [Enemella evansiae]OYO03376.1 hypothetical protein CGZ97_07895 [Enemella evansiae]